MPYLDDVSDRVALHAAGAMLVLPDDVADTLTSWLETGSSRRAAIASAMLARHGRIPELLAVASGEGFGRLWAIRTLGDLPEHVVRSFGDLHPGIEAALAPIWVQHADWLRTPETQGALDVLAAQRLRF